VTHPDVLLGDQDIDGFELDDGLGGRGRLVAAREQGGEAAGCDRNSKHYKTRSFHHASLSTRRDSRCGRSSGGLHHPKVNSWLMRRI
jgi:hypothetical protein